CGMAWRTPAVSRHGAVTRWTATSRRHARCGCSLARGSRSCRPRFRRRFVAPGRARVLHAIDMRVLITRPREDAEPFARARIVLGNEPVIEPLHEIDYLEGAPLDLIGVQAILLTSANGARAPALRTPRRDIAVIAVGPATAGAARAAGFANVS